MRIKSVNVTHASRTAVVWLNRPAVCNAMDGAMVRELDQTLEGLEGDSNVRAVVLAGQGPVFCSGVDLRWIKRMTVSSLAVNTQDELGMGRLLQRLDSMSKPTIARVHGAAYAGALGLIAACDIAVASLETDFCVSETRLGLSAATVAPFLVRAIGERQARRYMLSGEVFTAAEAYRIGLVHELAPLEDLDAKINDILAQLMRGGPKALPAAKEIIAQLSEKRELPKLISAIGSQSAKLRVSPEGREGVSAFFDKRQPAWTAIDSEKLSKEKIVRSGARKKRSGSK